MRMGAGWGGGIDHTAGLARFLLLFLLFIPPPPLSTPRHRETLLGGLGSRRRGVVVVGGPGQAEFTYLPAGSLPDFTEDIGGWYRES